MAISLDQFPSQRQTGEADTALSASLSSASHVESAKETLNLCSSKAAQRSCRRKPPNMIMSMVSEL